jgi:biopolymer transport protein ExbD
MPFGRLERTPGARPVAEINMTPLVDVMLVLLVVFMVTAPLLASRLQLDLPRAGAEPAAPPPAAPGSLRVALDAGGTLFLDEKVTGEAELLAAARRAAAAAPETEVLLSAERSVPYGRVAELIASLRAAGLSRVGLVTAPASGAER